MAEGFRGDRGGIRGLRELLNEYPEAIEYDLITLGLRLSDLGSERLSWRDLLVIVTRMPPHRSALANERTPEDASWTLSNHLLAEAIDSLRLQLWAKTKDAQRNRNRPKPIPRPGRRPEKIGKKPLPLDSMRDWLGWS